MNTTLHYMVFLFFGSLLTLTVPASYANPYRIEIAGNRLTADLENAPLVEVINDIGAKTGIRFIYVGDAAAAGLSIPFTYQFKSISLRKALEKLLAPVNHSIISDRDNNISQVYIIGAKSSSGSNPKIKPFAASANSTAEGVADPVAIGEAMSVNPSVRRSDYGARLRRKRPFYRRR